MRQRQRDGIKGEGWEKGGRGLGLGCDKWGGVWDKEGGGGESTGCLSAL